MNTQSNSSNESARDMVQCTFVKLSLMQIGNNLLIFVSYLLKHARKFEIKQSNFNCKTVPVHHTAEENNT